MRRYLLDTSVFITVERNYEPIFCTRFRNWLIAKNGEGKVFSIPAVYEELKEKDDALSRWAEQHRHGFFLPYPGNVTTAHGVVIRGVEQLYSVDASNRFLEAADSWLVTYAWVHRYAVVTYEKRASTLGAGEVKIPDACDLLDVRCICLSQPKSNAAG